MKEIEEMKKLVETLNKASDAYYNGKETLMSDAEFDLKLKHLEELEKELNVVLSNSPTVNVGAPVLKEIKTINMNARPMLSLAKVHSYKEIIDFSKGKSLVASIKCDGMSTRLVYEDGKLVSANSRGNGFEGSDLTEHIKHFLNVPLTIDKKGIYIVDGESIIKDYDFYKVNERLSEENKLKNSRNAVSGTLASLDTSIVDDRRVSFILWDVIEGCNTNNFNVRLHEASELGFEVVPYDTLEDITEENVKYKIEVLFEYSKTFGIPNDGVVFRINDINYGDSLGSTTHHFLNAVAYKTANISYPTKLIDVEWTMGKTGSLCPTIITEPVEIDGTSVSKASVHNVSIFKDFGFTKGCTCYLYKANLIIPQCEYVEDNNGEPFEVPSICPICGSPTEIKKDNDTEVLYCTNKNCKGLMLGKLNAFVSKQAMDIDGLSEATLELLMSRGYISTFKDLYHLSDYKTELSTLPKMGGKSVAKLLKSIENSRKTTLDKFLTALSIPGIGKSTARLISQYCMGDINVFTFIMSNTSLEFASIDGIGVIATTSLDNWWTENSEMFYELLEELIIEIPKEKKEIINTSINLSGKIFVITGALNHFENRNQLKELLESLSAKVSSSISAKTFALICNQESNSSKYKKSKELGINIWTEDELLKYIQG